MFPISFLFGEHLVVHLVPAGNPSREVSGVSKAHLGSDSGCLSLFMAAPYAVASLVTRCITLFHFFVTLFHCMFSSQACTSQTEDQPFNLYLKF